MKTWLILTAIVALTYGAWPAQAISSELSPETVLEVGRRVAHWQVDHFSNPPTNGRHNSWVKQYKGWVWGACYTGLVEFGRQTHDQALLDEFRRIGEANKWELGRRVRHADDWAVAWPYAELALQLERREFIAPSRARFDTLMNKSWDESLNWENKIHNRELAWCDALFMGPPALARLATATGDTRYLDFADKLWWKTTDYLYDTEERLYFRDSRYFDKAEPNGKKVFWARGNGWVHAGLTRLIEDLPADHANRQRYETLYLEMSAKLLSLQQEDGFWPTGLLDPVRWDKPESSGTAFFTYGLAWGVNRGLLDEATYRPAIEKGWRALLSVTKPDGRVTATQPIGADPYDFDPESVMPYGVGGFLLAATELYKMTLLEDAPSFAITGSNKLDAHRLNEVVELPWAHLPEMLPGASADNVVVLDELTGDLLLTQAIDNDGDGALDQLLIQAHFHPQQTKSFLVCKVDHELPNATSMVYGRAVPERLDDYAWESDRIAYRVYGPALEPTNDAGSGVDVWVKSVRYPILDKWYAGANYHKDSGEGLDYYKVGKSRGAGGLGVWADGKLWVSGHYANARRLANGPIRVLFELEFSDWDTPLGKVGQTQRISLDRASNLSRFESVFTTADAGQTLPIAIGLVQRQGAGKTEHGEDWLGYWEPALKPNGHTGVGVVLPGLPHELRTHTQKRTSGVGKKAKEETNTHVLAMTQAAPGAPLVYYAGAGWSKSGDFKDDAEWFAHLKETAARIQSPIAVDLQE